MKTVKSFFTEIRGMRYLLGALTTLVILDGLISHLLIKNGLAREANPFLATLVGGGNFLVIKVVGALLCAFILWDIYKHRPKLAVISSFCFTVVYAGIVLWNVCLFFVTQV